MQITQDEYYMNIAIAVRKKANCLGRRVGAVIVKENRIISTGYNGTPEGLTNCNDGGCVRCKDKHAFAPSVGYDVCICVHAEQNAVITAAWFGHAIEGSIVYSTLRPCFDCSKALLQAKVQAIYFIHDWQHAEGSPREQYNFMQSKFPSGVRKIDYVDPEADWADNRAPRVPSAVTNLMK
jgi:dCMP deaminase